MPSEQKNRGRGEIGRHAIFEGVVAKAVRVPGVSLTAPNLTDRIRLMKGASVGGKRLKAPDEPRDSAFLSFCSFWSGSA